MTSNSQRLFRAAGCLFQAILSRNYCLLVLVLAALDPVTATAQFMYQRIWSMGYASDSGSTAYSSLIEGPDGALYGTTWGGGVSHGTIFKVNTNGTGYRTLHQFNYAAGDGSSPYGPLRVGTNAVLYGTTDSGGSDSGGTIYQINCDGTGYRVLLHFGGTNGYYPRGDLIVGDDGHLYGTTQGGGTLRGGTVYKIHHDGTGFQPILNLPAFTTVGWTMKEGC